MKLHPVDVAKELQNFHFFRNFPEDLLLQMSTLVDTVAFIKGQEILREGDINKNLYFLRKGHAEVVLAGEVVAVLQNVGEVIGEMSVVTAKPVATTIRAASDVDCFVINTDNFSYVPPKEKDHFLHLLYRLYSNVLADRLVKTNEKARLFEIANRELHQAQMDLEKAGDKKVLLVESDRKQLALAKVAVGSTGVSLSTSDKVEQAIALLDTQKFDAVIVDEGCREFLKHAQKTNNAGKMIMMTTKEVAGKLPTLQEMSFVDYVMTRDPEDRHLTIRSILTTLTKVLSNDLFGLEKYLSRGVEVQSKTIKSSKEREEMRAEMCAYFKKLGVRNTILDRVNTASEELLMNAIYDAPTDAQGNSLFNHLPRNKEIILESHHQSVMRYACDGMLLAVSVTDPFGMLTKNIILRYLESCYAGQADINEKEGKGGAGRGLHQIVENSDLTIFNVKKGVKTEVISLFYVEGHKLEPQPSFHYFFV